MSISIFDDKIEVTTKGSGKPQLVFEAVCMPDGIFNWNLGMSAEDFEEFKNSRFQKKSYDCKYVSVKLSEDDPEYNFELNSDGAIQNTLAENDALAYMDMLNVHVSKSNKMLMISFEYETDIYYLVIYSAGRQVIAQIKMEDSSFELLKAKNTFCPVNFGKSVKQLCYEGRKFPVFFKIDEDFEVVNVVSESCFEELLKDL